MPALHLSIITINYHSTPLINSIELLIKRLDAIELIVVDNSNNFSPLETETRIITGKGNIGFGAGCNLGARYAGADILLFLNPDTKIDAPSIMQLLKKAPSNRKTIWAPAILDKTGKTRTLLQPGRFGLKYSRTYLDELNSSPIGLPVHYVSGACMMIYRDAFDRLGGFWDEIFLYAEDLEFCERAKEQGFDILVFGDISVLHVGGKSSALLSDKIKRLWRSYCGHYRFLSTTLGPLSAVINALHLASGVRI